MSNPTRIARHDLHNALKFIKWITTTVTRLSRVWLLKDQQLNLQIDKSKWWINGQY